MLLLIFILFIFLIYIFSSRASPNNPVKSLVRQTGRWAVASLQDSNPLVAIVHGNYAAGYLFALEDIATQEEIMRETHMPHLEFRKKILDIQDMAVKNLILKCPAVVPGPAELANLGGEGA